MHLFIYAYITLVTSSLIRNSGVVEGERRSPTFFHTKQNSCKIALFATVFTSISRRSPTSRSPTSFFRTTPLSCSNSSADLSQWSWWLMTSRSNWPLTSVLETWTLQCRLFVRCITGGEPDWEPTLSKRWVDGRRKQVYLKPV